MSGGTRWAIAGAGSISTDFASVLNHASKDEHVLVAVAARSLERAQKFAETHNIPNAYGSYEELAKAAKDNKIDVVYVGTVHPSHKDVCKVFINAGLNILCEKPFTVNARDARAVLELAKQKNVFVMEGFWSRFFPAYDELRKEFAAGTIGEPRFLISSFGRNVENYPDSWLNKKSTAGGGLMGLGCYNIQLAQMVFNHEKPQKIVATGVLNEKTGVDDFLSVTLVYSKNRMAVLNSAAAGGLDPIATITGSLPCGQIVDNAVIKMPNMWCPTELITPSGTKHFPLKNAQATPQPTLNAEGMIYEADAVRDCLLKGLKEHHLCSWDHTLQIMEIMDEIRRQIGLEYEWDKE